MVDMMLNDKQSKEYPLSFNQKNFYFIQSRDPSNKAFNLPYGFKVNFRIEPTILENAVNQVIKNHNNLRAIFYKNKKDQIVQTSVNNVNVKIDLICRDNISDQAIKDYYRKPFNLQTAPLFRIALFQNKITQENILLIVFHHIIIDGVGVQNFLKELFDYYDNPKGNIISQPFSKALIHSVPCPVSNENDKLINYWKGKLLDYEVLNLPYTKIMAKMNNKVDYFCVSISKKTLLKIKSLVQKSRVSTFVFFLSSLQILLSRYAGSSNITIATAVDQRYKNYKQDFIGDFTNLIIVKQNLDLKCSFYEHLQITNEIFTEGLANSGIDLVHLIKELGDDILFNAIKQVGLVYHILDQFPKNLEFIKNIAQESDSDINIEILEVDNQCIIVFKYNTTVFTKKLIKTFSKHYIYLLEKILYNPEQELNKINFLTKREKSFLETISLLNIPKDYEFLAVHKIFEKRALSSPQNIAVKSVNNNTSYYLLNKRANQLARFIQQKCLEIRKRTIQKGEIVPIFMDKGINFIISTLAIFKLGGAYVPLDVKYPIERINYILNEVKPEIILTEGAFTFIPNTFEHLIAINVSDESIAKKSSSNLNIEVQETSLAYIVFTSGSTGKPKGVMINHIGISFLAFFQAKKFNIDQSSVVLQFSPLSFDAFVSEVWTSLTSKSTLFIPDKDQHLFGKTLSEIIKNNNITVITLPPSILATLSIEEPCTLETLVVAGEACSKDLIKPWLKKIPLVINAYGPSEVTVCATMNKVTNSQFVRNIGLPLEYVKLYILNEYLQPVPESVPGELYIGGYGLARGYINNEILNNKSFIIYNNERIYRSGDIVKYCSKSKNIIYLGRNDNQIKLRGQRIELLEIEEILKQVPSIKECTVTVNKVNSHDSIVAYIVTANNTIDLEKIKLHVKQFLPNYMLPNYYVNLEQIPLNSNGKVNIKALPPVINKTNVFKQNNCNTLSDKLTFIWSELLSISKENINLEDNFFNLGGHSLLVIELISRIKELTGLELSIKTIFDFPKLKDLINIIDSDTPIIENVPNNVQDSLLRDIHQYTKLINECHNKQKQFSKKILLTGVTGFLGRFLLVELLNHTNSIIYCFIKNTNNILSSQEKLNRILIEIGCSEYVNNSRVICIEGDLNKPNLGLNNSIINELTKVIDSIFHCGAYVNHLHNYNTLRMVNVTSTINLLRIATTSKIKSFHYISTIDVVIESIYKDNNQGDFRLPSEIGPYNGGGYVQSKWVCERVLLEYIKNKYPVYIYRPGNITGHSITGFCIPDNNHALRLVKEFVESRVMPAWYNIPFEMTPVDIVSKIIVKLANRHNDAHIYNLHNLNSINWKNYMEKVSEQLNINIQVISPREWCQNILTKLNKDNILYPLKDLYKDESKHKISDNHSLPNYINQTLPLDLSMLYPTEEDYNKLIKLYITYLRRVSFI
jgi:amino acid adenylation domain-containing protein/thioester reductase-like protein